MLSERKNTILQSLIQEYVISAHPVASSTLARYYLPRLSAATVRNELYWLENQGYVISPHTSAGRMPTTIGYRTFVNSLLLRAEKGRIYFGSKELERAASLLTLSSSALPGFTALANATDRLAMIPEVLALLAEQNKGLMVFWAPQLANAIIHRGLPILLAQPEFAETSAALPIMQLLESHGDLMSIFEEIVDGSGLHIKIGSEHKDTQLYNFSLVAMRFDCAGLAAGSSQALASKAGGGARHYGVVALFGPTRMDYDWAISSISSLVNVLEKPVNRQL